MIGDEPDHWPGSAVNVWPATALPEIVGGEVFTGALGVVWRAVPSTTTRAVGLAVRADVLAMQYRLDRGGSHATLWIPGADLAAATSHAAQMVGSFGMAGSLISYEAVADGPLSRSNLVGKVLGNPETKQRVEDILDGQRERVREVLAENRDIHAALRDALMEHDELVRDEILEVIEKALANRL